MISSAEPIIEVKGLANSFGLHQVHHDLDLTINKGEIVAIIGESGCGKTTLIRSILMLNQPDAGEIKVEGHELLHASEKTKALVRKHWGVMFQSGALFSSYDVLDNIIFPVSEMTKLSNFQQEKVGLLKIALVGLEQAVASKFPAELSGGMKKRVAMARAIAMDPAIVFLDEPTAGLDPDSASELDDLILSLHDRLGITFVMITHDLDSLWAVPHRIAFLAEKKVIAFEPIRQLIDNPHPAIQQYFSSQRAEDRARLDKRKH